MSAQANYNYTVVRQFSIMTIVWGVVGMLVGVVFWYALKSGQLEDLEGPGLAIIADDDKPPAGQ